jgi:hypothetical protein
MELLAWAIGVGIVIVVLLAFRQGEFEREVPKYEMLDMPVPETAPALPPGRITPLDRWTRLGLIGAAFYYASQVGWGTPSGILLALVGTYVTVTGILGRDPVYWLLKRNR